MTSIMEEAREILSSPEWLTRDEVGHLFDVISGRANSLVFRCTFENTEEYGIKVGETT